MKSIKYITTIENDANIDLESIIKGFREQYGSIRVRGRHSNRKAVLGNYWRKHSQNDIPYKYAERIAFYKR
jgi:hypothetical protein